MTNIEARDHLRDLTKMIRNNANVGVKPELSDALEIAVKAIERLEPCKPTVNLWDKWIECPKCGFVLLTEDEDKEDYELDFCPSCGQPLDWSEEEYDDDK